MIPLLDVYPNERVKCVYKDILCSILIKAIILKLQCLTTGARVNKLQSTYRGTHDIKNDDVDILVQKGVHNFK